MENYKLSAKEGIWLLTHLLCAKLFLLTPSYFLQAGKSGALFIVLLLFLWTLILFGLFFWRTNGNVFDILQSRPLQTLFHILAFLLLGFALICNFSLFTYFLKYTAFPRSPYLFLAIPFGVGSMVCAASGIKSVGKVHGFFVPLLYGALLLFMVLNTQSFRLSNLFPLLGEGFPQIIKSSFFMLSCLFELLAAFYLPDLCKPAFKKIGISALLYSFLLYVLVVGGFLLIGGSQLHIPLFSVIRAGFFGRTDALFILLFAFAGLLYLSAMLYFTVLALGKACKLQNIKPLIAPIGLLTVLFSQIPFLSIKGQALLKTGGMILWFLPFITPLLCIPFAKEGNKCEK